MEADWVEVLDHIIGRTDVDFEEYVEVDNLLLRPRANDVPGADSPHLEFRRLQMINKAAEAAGAGFRFTGAAEAVMAESTCRH
jgi:hypothetical protein